MNTMVMISTQLCKTPRAIRPRAWRPIVPRLQRALVATLVAGATSLLFAFGLTASNPDLPSALPVVELPRVLIQGKRLRAPAGACTVRTDAPGQPCPVPSPVSP